MASAASPTGSSVSEAIGWQMPSSSLGSGPAIGSVFITYNTHQLLEAYYGVLEAGAVLNPINIRLTPREIAYILGHAGSKVVFFHKDFKPLVEALIPELPAKPRFVIMEGATDGSPQTSTRPFCPAAQGTR